MYARPVRLDEALRQLAGGARAIAGGTDLYPAAGERPLQGDFVDITGIPELRGVSREGQSLRFGAATTWDSIVKADLPLAFAALQAAAREVGAKSIQTRATIGGNLCNASPAADGRSAAAGARRRTRTVVRAGASALAAGKVSRWGRVAPLLRAMNCSPLCCAHAPPPTLGSTFLKLGARRYLVISIVMVAVALDVVDDRIRQARIAVGACSPVAQRLKAAEQKLVGAPASDRLGEALGGEDFAALTPIDDVRASEDYRREAALTLTRRAVSACLKGEAGGAV